MFIGGVVVFDGIVEDWCDGLNWMKRKEAKEESVGNKETQVGADVCCR